MSGIHDPEFRSIDGTGNNQDNPGWGRAGIQFLRKTDGINDNPAYGDGVETPAGATRPGAREVSNAVFAQSESKPSSLGTSDLFWAWGQFLDHDCGSDRPWLVLGVGRAARGRAKRRRGEGGLRRPGRQGVHSSPVPSDPQSCFDRAAALAPPSGAR